MINRLKHSFEFSSSQLNAIIAKGGAALLDQGLFAGSNFILNVLLVRWMRTNDYGLFATIYSAFLLFGTIHTAIITEPMLVLGSKVDREHQKGYLIQVLNLALIFSLGAFTILTLAALGAYLLNFDIWMVLFQLGYATPLMLFLWQARRACYMVLMPRMAAVGGAVYTVLTIVAIFFVYKIGAMSVWAALGILSGVSVLVGAWIFITLIKFTPKGSMLPFSTVFKQHWGYGKWALLASVFTWFPRNIYFFTLPLMYGLEINAVLKAQTNLVMPALQINTAIGVLLIPTMSKRINRPELKRFFWLAMATLSGISVFYWLVLSILRYPFINLMYASVDYMKYANLLIYLGLLPVLTAIIETLGSLLRAKEFPEQIMWAYFCATLITLALGYWFSLWWGLQGAIGTMLISYIVVIIVMAVAIEKKGCLSLP